MLRAVTVLASAAVLALSPITEVLADPCGGLAEEGLGGAVVGCDGQTQTPGDSATDQDTPQNVDYEPPEYWAYEPSWGTQPESGDPCIDLQFRASVERGSAIAVEWEVQTLQMTAALRLDGIVDYWCDAAPIDAVQTPTLLADGFVRRLPLPTPQLEIAPGFALTGMPAYLVIGNQDGFTVTETLEGWGAMQVTFTPSSFEVDWGDGTVAQVTDGRTGAAWHGPSAQQISHTYVDSDRARSVEGDTVVHVTSVWGADWSVAGFTGTVNGLAIEGSFDLPVREYRAVRVN